MPFRCSRTGMCYPDDYVEQWGRKYGIGLGPTPVSEALVSEYNGPIAQVSDQNMLMHPLATCKAQIDYIEKVSAEDIAAGKDKPILAVDDPLIMTRGPMMRAKQLLKSGTLRAITGN